MSEEAARAMVDMKFLARAARRGGATPDLIQRMQSFIGKSIGTMYALKRLELYLEQARPAIEAREKQKAARRRDQDRVFERNVAITLRALNLVLVEGKKPRNVPSMLEREFCKVGHQVSAKQIKRILGKFVPFVLEQLKGESSTP